MRAVIVVMLAGIAVVAFLVCAAHGCRWRGIRSASGSQATEKSRQQSLAMFSPMAHRSVARFGVPQLSQGPARVSSFPPHLPETFKVGARLPALEMKAAQVEEEIRPGDLKDLWRKELLRKMQEGSKEYEGEDFAIRAGHLSRRQRARQDRRKSAEALSVLQRWVTHAQNRNSDLQEILEAVRLFDFDQSDDMKKYAGHVLDSPEDATSLEDPPLKIGGVDIDVLLGVLRADIPSIRSHALSFHVAHTYFNMDAPRPRNKNAQVVIMREEAGQFTSLMQLRSANARIMPSHLASVGGKRDPLDVDSAATAVREVFEESGLLDVGLVQGAPKWLYEHAVTSGAKAPRAFIKYKETDKVDWYVLLLHGSGTFEAARDADACQDIGPLVEQLPNAVAAPCFGHAWISPYGVEHISSTYRLMTGLSRSVHQAVATLVCRGVFDVLV